MKLLRWLIFLTIGRVLDLLVIFLFTLYLPYFWFFIKNKQGIPLKANPWTNLDNLMLLGFKDEIRNDIFSNDKDSHSLMMQVGHGFFHPEWDEKMCEQAVDKKGSLYRYVPGGYGVPPSGDMLAAWCYFYSVCQIKRPDLVKKIAKHFLSNCFQLQDKNNNLTVRSANGGFNIGNADGWHGLSQPITGPAYLTGAAIFALAAKECGGIWKLTYWLHWLLLGGWYWNLVPWIYTKKDLIYYTAHVAQMSLYTISRSGINTKWPMRWIAIKCQPSNNVQPFLSGMAAKCGYLTKEEISRASEMLCSIAQGWPQKAPLDQTFLESGDNKHMNYSMMALVAVQLKGKI